jgi:hypothetical protein
LVQLKGRWNIDKKYIGRKVWIAFHHLGRWYLARGCLMAFAFLSSLDGKNFAYIESTVRQQKVLISKLTPPAVKQLGTGCGE